MNISMVKTNTGQNGIERAYERLAIAVVKNATEEYILAKIALNKEPEDIISLDKIEAAKRFFRTGGLGLLAEIDTQWLCDKLDQEAACRMNKKTRKRTVFGKAIFTRR